MNKVAIFTGNLTYSVRKGIVEINNTFPDMQILIAHHSPRKPIKKLLYNQWINIKKNGWRWIPYQSIDIYNRIIQSLFQGKKNTRSNPGSQYDWRCIKERSNLQYHIFNSLHEKKTLEKIKSFNPDLGIALSAPILKEPLFTIPLVGTINLHKGKIPFYRGMPPAFWELWNNEKEVGCTIHKVAAGLDTGDVLIESTIPISKYSTVKGMQLALDEMGISMMIQAINLLADGNPIWKKQEDGGKTYRKPTLKQQTILNKRLANPKKQEFVKHIIKELVFFCYIYLYRPIPSRFLAMGNKQRIIVLLYHRVNDDLRDTVTVGIEQFDRHMAILEKKYTVASIENIVRGDVPRNTSRPLIAVTFDDGYLDNYENAVPILLNHKIPAAFFISTGMIGSKNGFAHDLKKLGMSLPNMNWEQIAKMKQHGFTIGSHTISHINCAKATVENVQAEIRKSKEIIEERLSIDEVIFAYPFGKKEDMNNEMLEYVKKTGYVGCLSAYGGHNDNTINPFNIQRMGVDCNFTILAFRARLEGFVS